MGINLGYGQYCNAVASGAAAPDTARVILLGVDPTLPRYGTDRTQDSAIYRWLEFLCIADLSQDDSHERQQFVERVKSCRLARCNVLNLAFKKAGVDVSIGTKLDYESRPGLPSAHEKSRMDQMWCVSPKSSVSFR